MNTALGLMHQGSLESANRLKILLRRALVVNHLTSFAALRIVEAHYGDALIRHSEAREGTHEWYYSKGYRNTAAYMKGEAIRIYGAHQPAFRVAKLTETLETHISKLHELIRDDRRNGD